MRRSAVVIICWRISVVTRKRKKDVKNAKKTITGTKGRHDRDKEVKERERRREREIESEERTKREAITKIGWNK